MFFTHRFMMHIFSRPIFFLFILCGLLTSFDTPTIAASQKQRHPPRPASHSLPKNKKDLPPSPPITLGQDGDEDRGNKDIGPTVALFDAINRGDGLAARDAINRGADMNGHNILGQTPLDLSIDLNRNPITFLLLSLRDSDTAHNHSPAAQNKTITQHTVSTHVSNLNKNAPESVDDLAEKITAAPSHPTQHYDTSGGVAQPEQGFLGFNGS